MLKTFDIYYDISPLYLEELDKHLRACATDKEINLNICSPGGDIYAGIAIAEKLRACGKRVNARVGAMRRAPLLPLRARVTSSRRRL